MLNWLFLTNFNASGRNSWTGQNGNPTTTTADYTDERLHSLEITCAALWKLLKQKNGYTDDELKALMQPIPISSPNSANVLGDQSITECPECHHRLLTQNHTRCSWCGAQIEQKPFTP